MSNKFGASRVMSLFKGRQRCQTGLFWREIWFYILHSNIQLLNYYQCTVMTIHDTKVLTLEARKWCMEGFSWVWKVYTNCTECLFFMTTFISHDKLKRLKQIVTLTRLFSSRVSRILAKPRPTTCLTPPLMSARIDQGKSDKERAMNINKKWHRRRKII